MNDLKEVKQNKKNMDNNDGSVWDDSDVECVDNIQKMQHLCHRCMTFKDESEFYASCLRVRVYKCIDCTKINRYNQISRQKNETPDERLARKKRVNEKKLKQIKNTENAKNNTLRCNQCMIVKDFSKFHESSLRIRNYKCIDCGKINRYNEILKRKNETPDERRIRLTKKSDRKRIQRQVSALKLLPTLGASMGAVNALEQNIKMEYNDRIPHITLPK